MDIAALSIVLNQGKLLQQADISVMKLVMGVAADQGNSITVMANETTKTLELAIQPHMGAIIDILA